MHFSRMHRAVSFFASLKLFDKARQNCLAFSSMSGARAAMVMPSSAKEACTVASSFASESSGISAFRVPS